MNQYQESGETGNLFATRLFKETRRGGGHSRNERCPVGAESESRPLRAELRTSLLFGTPFSFPMESVDLAYLVIAVVHNQA